MSDALTSSRPDWPLTVGATERPSDNTTPESTQQSNVLTTFRPDPLHINATDRHGDDSVEYDEQAQEFRRNWYASDEKTKPRIKRSSKRRRTTRKTKQKNKETRNTKKENEKKENTKKRKAGTTADYSDNDSAHDYVQMLIKFKKFNCMKHTECQNHHLYFERYPERTCAQDLVTMQYTWFHHKCSTFVANCRMMGLYFRKKRKLCEELGVTKHIDDDMLNPIKRRVSLTMLLCNVVSKKPGKETKENSQSDTSDKFVQFQCWKAQYCSERKEKACGFDQFTTEIAVFDNLCTMYKANCKMATKYFPTNMEVCDVKIKYQAEFGNDFEWEPISRPTTKSTSFIEKPINSTATNATKLKKILKISSTDDAGDLTRKNAGNETLKASNGFDRH